jgi:hypothetical protein
MESVRSLRELFASLSGGATQGADPAAVLAAGGHGELPDHLVAEAIGSYADTAPVEVAEHLSGYVVAHSAASGLSIPDWHPGDGLALLVSAPQPGPGHDQPDGLVTSPVVGSEQTAHLDRHHDGTASLHERAADLDFGRGHEPDQPVAAHTVTAGFEPDQDAGTEHELHPVAWTVPELEQPVHQVDDVSDEQEHHHWADHESAHPLELPDHDAGDGFHPGAGA